MKATKARELFKMAEENGWTLDHVAGSHHIYKKAGCRSIPIPGPVNHMVGAGLALKIKKQLGVK